MGAGWCIGSIWPEPYGRLNSLTVNAGSGRETGARQHISSIWAVLYRDSIL